MSELRPLGPEARAAIAAEVHAPGAEPAARRRLRDRLWTALAIAPIVPALPPAVPPGAAIHSATLGSGVAGHSVLSTSGRLLALVARYPGPVVAASLTMGGLGGVALHAELGPGVRRQNPAAIQVARNPPPPLPQTLTQFPLVTPPAVLPGATVPLDTKHVPPSPGHGVGVRPPSRSLAPPAATSLPATDADLVTEAALLEHARTALARGWVEPAQAALDQHRLRFPDGQLLEEREALSVLALARGGRTEDAARLATTFQKRFPNSLWREQVDTATPPHP